MLLLMTATPDIRHPVDNGPIIHARGLSRIYRRGKADVVGVRGIDLDIEAGAMVVLKGVSGSGKSTLLGLLAGLDHPTDGRLSVAGHDLSAGAANDLTDYRRTTVGMVFQNFNLLPTLTVLENICLPAMLAHADDRAARSRAGELLEWLDMTSRRDHLPEQLSGGEMQRTAIARALINDPAIILADEPTGNLDSQNGERVVRLLSDLNRQWHRTVIFATHSAIADAHATVGFRLSDGIISTES